MAEKKSIHTKENSQPVDNRVRRSLLTRLWWVLGGIALAEIGWVAGSFLHALGYKKKKESVDQLFDAGPADRFTPDTVSAFPQGRFYLVRLDDGGFLALSRRCTHLGCTVPWYPEKKQFICPCHASVFNIRGEVIHAPAPRPLDRFTVSIENKRVKVSIGKPIRRKVSGKAEVVYTNSPRRIEGKS